MKKYIAEVLQLDDYEISETEFGVIPMTNAKFEFNPSKNIYSIGIAGGQTKASSGYTFRFIQKQTAQLVNDLINNKPLKANTKSKHGFYDSVLLNILANNKYAGDKIFTKLFEKNNHNKVFRFLDNESSLMDDVLIFGTLPVGVFAKAALEELTI